MLNSRLESRDQNFGPGFKGSVWIRASGLTPNKRLKAGILVFALRQCGCRKCRYRSILRSKFWPCGSDLGLEGLGLFRHRWVSEFNRRLTDDSPSTGCRCARVFIGNCARRAAPPIVDTHKAASSVRPLFRRPTVQIRSIVSAITCAPKTVVVVTLYRLSSRWNRLHPRERTRGLPDPHTDDLWDWVGAWTSQYQHLVLGSRWTRCLEPCSSSSSSRCTGRRIYSPTHSSAVGRFIHLCCSLA